MAKNRFAAKLVHSNQPSIFFFMKQAQLPPIPTPPTTKEGATPSRPSIQDRIDSLVDKASSKWEHLSKSEEGSMKRRLYSFGNRMMDRIDADEWFLKEVPRHAGDAGAEHRVVIRYPVNLNQLDIEERLRALVRERISLHAKGKQMSLLALPFSIMFGIIPGPNLPLAYNLFRLYSHNKALNGAKYFDEHVLSSAVLSYRADETLHTILQSSTLTSTGNQGNDEKVKETEANEESAVISIETIEAISNTLSMPEFFMHDAKRARNQLLLSLKSANKT